MESPLNVDCSWCTKTELPSWYGNEDGTDIILCKDCMNKSLDNSRSIEEIKGG